MLFCSFGEDLFKFLFFYITFKLSTAPLVVSFFCLFSWIKFNVVNYLGPIVLYLILFLILLSNKYGNSYLNAKLAVYLYLGNLDSSFLVI